MASVGDGERPRLPETDDPYVLLDIAPDADVRAIRKAYARMVRIYRPDRAPKEFQRIHAAFEEARRAAELGFDPPIPHELFRRDVRGPAGSSEHGGGGERSEAARDHGDEGERREGEHREGREGERGDRPASEGSAAERARAAEIARRLDEASALDLRGEHAAVAAVIDALLDERAPLRVIAGHAEGARLLARHPALSWTRLARAAESGEALEVVWMIWNQAWLAAYPGDAGRARDLLDDDRLRLDAADDLQLAALCLVRIGALAWRRGRDLRALLDRYRAAIPAHPALDSLLAAIELDVAAGPMLHRASFVRTSSPLALVGELLATARIGDLASRRAAAGALLAALEHDLDAMLQDLEALSGELDLAPLFEVIYEHLPIGATRLDGLDPEQFAQLTAALHELGREPHRWTAIGAALGVIAVAGATAGVLGGLAVLVVALGAFAATERRRYLRGVRPALARLLLRLPVTTWVVSRWIQLNGRLSGRLSRFDVAIDADGALYALSMLAAAASVIGELDEPDPADPAVAPGVPDDAEA